MNRRFRVFFSVAVALLVVFGSAVLLSDTRPPFTKRDKAFFADPAAVNFVRPGLVVKIVSATIASDGTIQADFTVTDPQGLGLDISGVNTPGTVSLSWIPAVLPQNRTEYLDYLTRNETDPASGRTTVEATSETNGKYQQVRDGEYIYTFAGKAPAGFDAHTTHSIGVYASRNLTAFDMGTQYSNFVYNFVPDGSPVTRVHDIVMTAACNQCHDPLAAHGGARQIVELCVLCHTDQTTDAETNNTVDFRVMIHKIHMGANLPSVRAGHPYQIVGFNNAVNDWSTVVFPAESPANCQYCHKPGPANANAWVTRPSRAACGSCHDNVNFATGEGHSTANLPVTNDALCSQCHTPEGSEFDASIMGAHTLPRFSTQLPGVVFGITSVTNTKPGQKPVVVFTLKDKSGNPIQPSDMTSLSLVLAYPTRDYMASVSESARGATAGANGAYTYTFSAAIPSDATGSGTVGIEGYRNSNINPCTVIQQTVRDAGQNVDVDFAITDPAPVPRRVVVATQNCNQCHFHLAAHGGIRNETKHCVLCHNPNATDAARRPAAQQPAESIDFPILIHRIHTGENNETPYVIYGGSPTDFSDVRFPGDRRDCRKCHVGTSYELPLPAGHLNVQTPRGPITPTEGPTTAACLGCHTAQDAAAHAQLNASPTLGEACAVCHGVNADFAVDKVHAR